MMWTQAVMSIMKQPQHSMIPVADGLPLMMANGNWLRYPDLSNGSISPDSAIRSQVNRTRTSWRAFVSVHTPRNCLSIFPNLERWYFCLQPPHCFSCVLGEHRIGNDPTDAGEHLW